MNDWRYEGVNGHNAGLLDNHHPYIILNILHIVLRVNNELGDEDECDALMRKLELPRVR
jgi:hypothetical protein